MYLEPNMKQVVIRRTVRSDAEHFLAPLTAEMDRTGRFPVQWRLFAAARQYFGLEIPQDLGGAGLDAVSACIVIEEVSRVSPAMGLCISVHNGVALYPIFKYGDDHQKERYLRVMASGDAIGSFCLTEPNAGSDASSLETTAVRRGDNYVLNGTKIFVTNGGVSAINLIFSASLSESGKKVFTLFIVESDRKGLEKGPAEDLMGMRGNPVCSISLDDCEVPLESRLGGEGEGMRIAIATLHGGRIGIGAQAIGIAQGCLDASILYSRQRIQFGRSISEQGAVQGMLADMAVKTEAARLLVYRAASLREKGLEHGKESAMAKLLAGEAAVEAARSGLQIHGGYGYTKAYPIERFYRDAKVCEIYEGTSEVQRMVICRALLK
ncbi:MAG: acyl-CoA dehydrogenase [Deltaproteobacteria bacterium CG23_combo_of_CG06-09_8_20_14_all_51_20]|nr:acyl-CoA dehydrogenase [bacterium]OIP42718.1 MAG: acyl-CoA dehydrogenase [Desulfobacteraceae bacterium CG2_30_51_40]PIP47362.1 MAG: acyl-CoA dehydrogenase [Deltaproteobacteria bacterium CG23_combo_of_CG06-09_8_20_14_all_51_20]PIW01564.1 MAG: acyl-CoA dehydrogenase [Deltaproteobacteria bacterium CG17_big_fil_post_rev_8_21_14_2_50_51_6]PIY23114.1 MAG: acyl-CoA dehydrogenase [Deltaproteobacteria bacterium CG_4_10_14_3_um_filter_51_14]PJB36563.1 MAG: acyl-CoA dehydrogenase [Deltaproteobacteria 